MESCFRIYWVYVNAHSCSAVSSYLALVLFLPFTLMQVQERTCIEFGTLIWYKLQNTRILFISKSRCILLILEIWLFILIKNTIIFIILCDRKNNYIRSFMIWCLLIINLESKNGLESFCVVNAIFPIYFIQRKEGYFMYLMCILDQYCLPGLPSSLLCQSCL